MLKKRRTLFFVILSIAICLRLFNLDKGYNSDEGWLLETAKLDLNTLIPSLEKGRSVYPPLSPFLLHFWTKLNEAELWVRGYFVAFGVALCVLVYHLGKFYLDGHFGSIAFFLCSISPLLIWSSQFVRSYIDSAFWSILSVYFMLRMLKGKNFWRDSLGYVIFSALALYSSYLNVLILLSQNIFIFILYFKDFRFLKRWLILQIIVAIIFIPCVPIFLSQLKLATAIDPKWSERGFQLFGLNVGYYARSITATFGMDPNFLTTYPLLQKFNKITLISLAALSFCIVGWVFIIALKNIRTFFEDKKLVWFFPFISISALILYDILAELMNFPIQAEYFVPQHVLFIFVISSVIYPTKSRNTINVLAAVLIITLVFISRFQDAVSPEFETKKANNFLVKNMKITDCLLMARNTNYYIDSNASNVIILYNSIRFDAPGYYKTISDRGKTILPALKTKYKDLWFYRTYGNDEILGVNELLMNWFQENGYIIESVQKFRRIDIIHYKRSDKI